MTTALLNVISTGPIAGGDVTLAFGLPGGSEWIILLVLGLLIFGRRLPEVGRSLGRGIVEFKRGIKGIDDEIEEASNEPAKVATEATKPKLAEGTEPRGSTHAANPYAAPAEAEPKG